MCGIAGIINTNSKPVPSNLIKRMTDMIAHRGPDGEGHWQEGFVALGHRRLSIIDLSSDGQQPMISYNKRYVISYNGEVYNFKEIRIELKKIGYSFKSRTDTEVVLNSFIEWGPACIHRFNGMFAYAIWDKKQRVLHFARDRYGIKPLYYGKWGKTFVFASEQKAILETPIAKIEIDKKALLEYFTFQNIFTENTLIKNIKLFPPAHTGSIDMNESIPELKLKRYWDFNFSEPKESKDKQEYVDELHRLLKQAVNRQLVSDVELGSYLSGGLDSGIITALASKNKPNMKSFTCGFDLSSASGLELTFDERRKAEALSAIYKTEHYQMVLKSGDMERCLPKFTWHLEEPRVGQSYPNYYVAGLASKFVKVVLSGIGGDELFAGYPWRYYRGINSNNFEEYIDDYYLYWQRLIPNKKIKKIFSPIWSDVKDVWTRDIFRDVFINHHKSIINQNDYINHSLYFEARTFLHGLLIVEDKLSMANSLESRVPFLDNDLVDFAMSCPVGLKLNNLKTVQPIDENDSDKKTRKYFIKTKDGKHILRDVSINYVPNAISKGLKQGFSSPDASWFKGESIEFIKCHLFNKSEPIYNLLDYGEVKSLINDHLSGRENRRLLIWSLLNVNEYLEQNL
ncbi:MAG: asparagine synthase (glutamine-hydrolyzing) [Candidatus Neomarinimicrobiota bacterium]